MENMQETYITHCVKLDLYHLKVLEKQPLRFHNAL